MIGKDVLATAVAILADWGLAASASPAGAAAGEAGGGGRLAARLPS